MRVGRNGRALRAPRVGTLAFWTGQRYLSPLQMPAPPLLPPKKDVTLALLKQSSIFVHLDPRQKGVRVPEGFKKQPQLVLQLGLNMAVPIPDLDVGEEGIGCTLSFNRTPHYCWIPWQAIFALVGENHRGMVWPDDVPKEVADQSAQQQRRDAAPKLRAVAPEAKPAPAAEVPSEKPKKKRARKAKAAVVAKPKVAVAQRSPRRHEAPPPLPAESVAQGADDTRATADEGKRKRELPPYLRVIK